MSFYWFVLGVLCVWRITHVLNAEDGPGDALVKFRKSLGSGVLGRALDCFYCLSVWVALPLAWYLGNGWKERLLLWPALSAGAILIERATAAPTESNMPQFYEDLNEDSAPGEQGTKHS